MSIFHMQIESVVDVFLTEPPAGNAFVHF